MAVTDFDRGDMAKWYAKQHLATDPAVQAVYYLPTNSDDCEIRFIEVNASLADRNDDTLEPIDFGVDMGKETEHRLVVLDVTPKQWDRINSRDDDLQLPPNWSLENAVRYPST